MIAAMPDCRHFQLACLHSPLVLQGNHQAGG